MALDQQDLQAIDSIVTKRVMEGTDSLALLVNGGFQAQQDYMTLEFQKVNNRLDSLDAGRADFRSFVRLLHKKNVISGEDAKEHGAPATF